MTDMTDSGFWACNAAWQAALKDYFIKGTPLEQRGANNG